MSKGGSSINDVRVDCFSGDNSRRGTRGRTSFDVDWDYVRTITIAFPPENVEILKDRAERGALSWIS